MWKYRGGFAPWITRTSVELRNSAHFPPFEVRCPAVDPVAAQEVEQQAFTASEVTKDDLLLAQTYFGWSSEDVDMQARL